MTMGYLDAGDVRLVEQIAEDLYFDGTVTQSKFQWVASVYSALRPDGPSGEKSGAIIETSRTGVTADDALRNLVYALRQEGIVVA